jgi:hypothetical protein
MKFLLASLKTLANYKSCSGFPLLSLVNFFLCRFPAGFQNNIQNNRQVWEQLLKAQAAIRKPEQAL